jgi:hypothetical protein
MYSHKHTTTTTTTTTTSPPPPPPNTQAGNYSNDPFHFGEFQHDAVATRGAKWHRLAHLQIAAGNTLHVPLVARCAHAVGARDVLERLAELHVNGVERVVAGLRPIGGEVGEGHLDHVLMAGPHQVTVLSQKIEREVVR